MSGTVNAAGWYNSTNRELENASLPSVISEDIHNIEHYYNNRGPSAPIVQILYGSYVHDGTPLFFRASNMPHTEDIIEKKFTAFAPKQAESMVATHGYGGVLPSMYIGGNLEIQFLDLGRWKRIALDIEAQRGECEKKQRLTTLPSKAMSLGVGGIPLIENAKVWPVELLELFKTHNICTIELHENPTFKGHGNIRETPFFSQFLESVQSQFEEILTTKVDVTGIYIDDNNTVTQYKLPYNFYQKLHNPETRAFPKSPYGIADLEVCKTVDVDYTDTSVHCRTTIGDVPIFFAITDKGCQSVNPIPDFTTRFQVRIGKVNEDTYRYASALTVDPKHPMYIQNLQAFADGLLVNLSGYRMTLKPLMGRLQRSQYLPYMAHTRVLVDVCDQETKRKFIDAKAHKDTSSLKTIRSGTANLLETVVITLCKLLKKCPTDTDLYRELTEMQVVRRRNQRKAVERGHSYEKNCLDMLQQAFGSSTYSVIGNDIAIRRSFLGTEDKQYQGIDILVQSQCGVTIAIQCKRKERVSAPDYESFIRTLQYAREKYPSDYIHGLFVVQKPIDVNQNCFELLETPGVNLVYVPDKQLDKLTARVTSTLNYYTTQN